MLTVQTGVGSLCLQKKKKKSKYFWLSGHSALPFWREVSIHRTSGRGSAPINSRDTEIRIPYNFHVLQNIILSLIFNH